MNCIYPQCDKKANARGLCNQHYGFAHGMIKNRLTTWEKLEANGKSLPLGSHYGIGRRTKVHAWFLEESKPNPSTD